MKRKGSIVALVVLLCVTLGPVAMADSYPITGTGDNFFAAWFLDGTGFNAFTSKTDGFWNWAWTEQHVWAWWDGVSWIDPNSPGTPLNSDDVVAPAADTNVSISSQDDSDGSSVPVPEPALILMLGVGLGAAGLAGYRRKR